VADLQFHPAGTAERWREMSLVAQLGNVGSEVARSSRAKAQGNQSRHDLALARALELFDLTLGDPRWQGRRKEIARAREVVCDFLVGDNEYRSTAASLDAYFLPYAVAARSGR
jgi:hypothetical protein